MGQLVDGNWQEHPPRKSASDGRFHRQDTQFRNWITADGKPGPTGEAGFKAEAGRYHLYVCLACPWAHRTLIFRQLKGLQDVVPVSVVDHFMGKNGWTFSTAGGGTGDRLYGADFLHEIYTRAQPDYTGRVSVPVLWDTRSETIVSNESSEIIRMFNSAFDGLTGNDDDYYPQSLRGEIDEINERVYNTVNNGVYRSGFATTQEAYEEAFGELFATLDWLDGLLSRRRYLTGDRITEADWRLFTTLIRFDHVYFGHFKCNLRRITDYPNLSGYTRELYQVPGIADTVNLDHIKKHYYGSHESINPTRIVPKGPDIDFTIPHGRGG